MIIESRDFSYPRDGPTFGARSSCNRRRVTEHRLRREIHISNLRKQMMEEESKWKGRGKMMEEVVVKREGETKAGKRKIAVEKRIWRKKFISHEVQSHENTCCRKREEGAAAAEAKHNKDIFIPHHLVVDHILLRLPLDSLIMCKLVCKQWNSSISDPSFMKLHKRLHGKGKTQRHILIAAALHRDSGVSVGSVEVGERIRWVFSLPLSRQSWGISSSLHGLVCVFDGSGRVYVCNPATGDQISLPSSNIATPSNASVLAQPIVALGFDPLHRWYKVIRLWCLSGKKSGMECEVLTLGGRPTDPWRRIGHVPYVLQSSPPACIKSNLYWMTFEDSRQKRATGIAAFNVIRETLKYMDLPRLRKGGLDSLAVVSVGGRLCIVQVYISPTVPMMIISRLQNNWPGRWMGVQNIGSYFIHGYHSSLRQATKILDIHEEEDVYISMKGELLCRNSEINDFSKVELPFPFAKQIRYEPCFYSRSPASVKWRSC